MPRDVRGIKVAAAQMGPNNEGTSREEIVERMLGLLAEAVREGVVLIAYPEMALTTYFPKKIRPDFDQFFETEVPPKALEPLLRRAAEARIAATRRAIARSRSRARRSFSSATTRQARRSRSTSTSSVSVRARTRTSASWSASPRRASRTAWS